MRPHSARGRRPLAVARPHRRLPSDAACGPRGVAVACAAPRRSYLDRLRAAAHGVRFVLLDGDAAQSPDRTTQRSAHYVPPALLSSQLQTFERPGPDEADVQRVGIDIPAAEVIEQIAISLRI
jgi:gluconokinase